MAEIETKHINRIAYCEFDGFKGQITKWNDDLYMLRCFRRNGKLEFDSWCHSVRSAKIRFGKYFEETGIKWKKYNPTVKKILTVQN